MVIEVTGARSYIFTSPGIWRCENITASPCDWSCMHQIMGVTKFQPIFNLGSTNIQPNFNVELATLIQHQHFNVISIFKPNLYFNVDSTLKFNVDSTLNQRLCACWDATWRFQKILNIHESGKYYLCLILTLVKVVW